MADNTVLNTGSGGDTIASDDIGGVKHQRVKLSIGADGSATDAVPVSAGLDTTGAAVQAVGLVAQFDDTTPSAVTENQFAPVRLSSRRALLVEGVASGTAVTVDGSAVTQPVSAASLPLPSGAATAANQTTIIGHVDGIEGLLTTIDADTGTLAGAVSGTEVQVDVVAALPAGTNNIGDVDILSIAAGDNNIGNVDVVTVPADPFGANADAAATAGSTGSIQAKLRLMTSQLDAIQTAVQTLDNIVGGSEAQVDVVTLPNVTLAAGTNTNEVVGDAAHDAAVAGNPVLVGAEARTSEGTAVANADACRLTTNSVGKLVVIPDAVAGATWSYAAASGGITTTTGVTVKTAAGAGVRNYLKSIQVINGHATVDTDVQIRDGASGTVLHRGFAKAAGGGYAANFEPPLRGTANTLLEVACGTTGAAVYVNAQGYTSAE